MQGPRSIKVPDLGLSEPRISDLFGTLAQVWLGGLRRSVGEGGLRRSVGGGSQTVSWGGESQTVSWGGGGSQTVSWGGGSQTVEWKYWVADKLLRWIQLNCRRV